MLIHCMKINSKKIICDYNYGGWGWEGGGGHSVCFTQNILK